MAHQNGRIYIDTNTTPHKGVEIADLQQVLGRGVNDLGLLCSDQEWYALPYQRIKYLKNTGASYIDVGHTVATSDLVTIWKGEIGYATGSSGRRYFAAYNNGSYKHYCEIGSANLYGSINAYIQSALSPETLYDADFKINGGNSIDYGIIINGQRLTINSTTSHSTTMGSFVLFRVDGNSPGSGQMIGHNELWYDGVLIRDLYPVRVGDVGYMYDLVSGQLFGNSGSGSFVLGEDVDSHLLRPLNPPRINKWAKWKPIVHTALSGMTSAVRKTANQGFVVSGSPSFIFSESDGANAFAAARDNGQDWTYIKPTGGIGVAPFRLRDFSNEDTPSSYGYNHNAVRFVIIHEVVNDPTDENLDVKVRVDFYYTPGDLSFDDFAAITNMATQNNATWYWCLFVKPPQQSSPSILPLYTDQTYATRMAVGSASATIKRGFTHLTVNATASGNVEAYLGLVCLSNQTSGVIGCLYAPTDAPATFTLKNTSTELRAGFLPMLGGMTGMQVSWAEDTVNRVTAFASSLQILFLGYQSLTNDWIITVTERIYGKLNGSYQGYKERVNTITVNSTTGGGAVNGQWTAFSPLNNEDVDDLGYSLKLQFGQETPIYFYYDGSVGMQMSATEVISRIGDIKELNDIGSYTYVQITKIN